MRINEQINKLLPAPEHCTRFKIGDCVCHTLYRSDIIQIIGYTENYYIMEVVAGILPIGITITTENDKSLTNYIRILRV